MYMQVVNALATIFTIVDNGAEAIFTKTFLFGNFSGNNHEMAYKSLMTRLSFGKSTQSIFVLWYDQKVDFGRGCDIPER